MAGANQFGPYGTGKGRQAGGAKKSASKKGLMQTSVGAQIRANKTQARNEARMRKAMFS